METLFFRVAAASAAAAVVLAVLLAALPWWGKRYAPNTRRAVWLALTVVLLIAPLLPRMPAPVQITVPERTVTLPVPTLAQGQQTPAQAEEPSPAAGADRVETQEERPVSEKVSAHPTVSWTYMAAVIWAVGAVAVLLWQAVFYALSRRRLMRRAAPLTGYEALAAELCPGRPVRFFRVKGLSAPMTFGALRPVVALPQGEIHPAAVHHELIHIRRWDVAWKGLILLACALHWFNPLVWLLSRRAEGDMEAACDALVVAGQDATQRRVYGELLLHTAAGQRFPLTTRFSGEKARMKTRLRDLYHPGKGSCVLVLAVAIVCLLAGGLTACRSTGQTTDNGDDGAQSQNVIDEKEPGAVADGIYCAPMPESVTVDGQTNWEQWQFTLSTYDPETGERGTQTSTQILPLAQELTLWALGAEQPTNAGTVGTQEWNRQVVGFLSWPLVRSSFSPDATDLLEVRVQDGAVTALKWFQVPKTASPDGDTEGEDPAPAVETYADSEAPAPVSPVNTDSPTPSVDDPVKEDIREDTVSLTEKEDAVVSELETLSSVLRLDGISYIVTNGSTGEQVHLATPSDVDKMKSLLNDISILSRDDELSVGYLYAIRAEDENGNLSDAICVYKDRVQIGSKVGYSVKNDEQLRDYLKNLF